MECWSNGVLGEESESMTPPFHHSILQVRLVVA